MYGIFLSSVVTPPCKGTPEISMNISLFPHHHHHYCWSPQLLATINLLSTSETKFFRYYVRGRLCKTHLLVPGLFHLAQDLLFYLYCCKCQALIML